LVSKSSPEALEFSFSRLSRSSLAAVMLKEERRASDQGNDG
jgi:hypothetical protein